MRPIMSLTPQSPKSSITAAACGLTADGAPEPQTEIAPEKIAVAKKSVAEFLEDQTEATSIGSVSLAHWIVDDVIRLIGPIRPAPPEQK